MHVVSVLHTRSLTVVGAVLSYCVLVHVVNGEHTRLLFDVGAVDWY